jgi:hypothetical protein
MVNLVICGRSGPGLLPLTGQSFANELIKPINSTSMLFNTGK